MHARSAEQPINLDEGDQYDWPWLYAVEVGHWNLTDAQAKAMREYLLRGGFFMCDDFHGTEEWAVFIASMQRVFPDRPIVEIPNTDPIFHTIYDLDDRYQVPGAQYVRSHRTYEYDGYEPHWRGIYDDKGRLMVAICFDMDLGDSWEHADNPEYPREVLGAGNPHRRQLRGVRHDALRGADLRRAARYFVSCQGGRTRSCPSVSVAVAVTLGPRNGLESAMENAPWALVIPEASK